jgi:hypothetical protein
MRKTCIVAILAGICGIVQATTITAPLGSLPNESFGSPVSGNAPYMEIGNGYEWGITKASLGGAANLTSFSITVTATLYNESSGNLDFYLINSAPISGFQQVTQSTVTSGVLLVAEPYSEYTTTTNTFALSSSELNSLNLDIENNGGFDLGFNPNCTYAISSVRITYNTPDTAATVLLLGASLLGLEVFRRKFVPATNQA